MSLQIPFSKPKFLTMRSYKWRICIHLLFLFVHYPNHILRFQESKLSLVCERVLDRCLAPCTARGEGCDNMTMILVQLKKPNCSGEKSLASEEELPKLTDGGL